MFEGWIDGSLLTWNGFGRHIDAKTNSLTVGYWLYARSVGHRLDGQAIQLRDDRVVMQGQWANESRKMRPSKAYSVTSFKTQFRRNNVDKEATKFR